MDDLTSRQAEIDALEKQIPMKPMAKEMSVSGRTIIPCGNCGEEIKRVHDFCPWCGQKIDWGKYDSTRSDKAHKRSQRRT